MGAIPGEAEAGRRTHSYRGGRRRADNQQGRGESVRFPPHWPRITDCHSFSEAPEQAVCYPRMRHRADSQQEPVRLSASETGQARPQLGKPGGLPIPLTRPRPALGPPRTSTPPCPPQLTSLAFHLNSVTKGLSVKLFPEGFSDYN